MNINFTLLVLCLFTSILVQSCGFELEDPQNYEFEKKANFPDYIKEYGKSIATELRETVKNLNKMGVDYSDADETDLFKKRFYNDFYQACPTIIKTKGSMDLTQLQISRQEFAKRINNLTKIQLKFINRIIKECGNSTSYENLYCNLIDINNDIYSEVPSIQQDRLFTITAILYYGMKEIQDLEKQGLMPATPQSTIRHLTIKTRSESDNSGDFGESCRKFIASGWAIAVGEPTPAGEIVMSVVTIGYLLYEVIVCLKEVDCTAKYVECVNSGTLSSWKCNDCRVYCEGQNVWDCPRPY